MDLFSYFGHLNFGSFQGLVEIMCSAVPVWILTVFTVNLLFSIFDDILHLGGRK